MIQMEKKVLQGLYVSTLFFGLCDAKKEYCRDVVDSTLGRPRTRGSFYTHETAFERT